MKILVTGGAGFIGSHLCKRLLDSGNQVIAIDNLFTGSKDNIKELLENKNFKFYEHDIVVPFTTLELDQIYNLACPASPVHYQHDPVKTTVTSVSGIINMLELTRKNNARILQASTSEIYGDPMVHPQVEEYWGNVNTIGPRACYDEGKRCAETLCFDYYRQYQADIKVIRIFNTYGPNMHQSDGRVVSNFIVQALKNEDITIYGSGEQTRSFQYVDDLVEGMIKMMAKDNFTGPVNLGNPKESTIKQLAEMVIAMTPGTQSKIIYKELPQDDPSRRKPDIGLAIKELNWEPKVKLEQGLIKTIEYFKTIIK